MRSAFLSFSIMYTALAVLLYAYLSRRLFSFGWPTGRTGYLLLAVPFVISYLMPFLLFKRQTNPNLGTPDLLFWIVYLSMSFIGSLLAVVVVRDLLYLLVKIASLLFPAHLGTWPGALETELVTRILLSASLLVTAWGLFESHRTPRVHTIEVPLAHLAPAFDGYRVVLMSDLHAGPTIKKPFLERVVKTVNNLDADLAVLPGDVADGSAQRLDGQVFPLAEVKAKDGRFYTTGNHEYYWGAAQWVAQMKALGWTPLLNDHRVVTRGKDQLVVAGITDFAAIHMDPPNAPNERKAIEGAPKDAPILWLSHQPTAVRDVMNLGNGLMLAGHTHGGQCFPWNMLLGLFQPYEKGLYHVGNTTLYVTPGTGYWGPPNRFGVPSEITLVILRSTTHQ